MLQRNHPLVFAFLFPLTLIYGAFVYLRNMFFDWGWLPSQQYKIAVICIGNLTVGGTGKTPHVEYLIRLLENKFVVAVLSRGYNRRSKGFILANDNSTADDIGDESLQIKLKFKNIIVAVCESRVNGIEKLLKLFPEINLIILDDAFQHRYVDAGMNILLIDFNRPLHKEYLLPAGNLREQISGKERANLFVITKCPDKIKPIDKRLVIKSIHPRPYQTCFFSSIAYRNFEYVFPSLNSPPTIDFLSTGNYKILLVTGIANSAVLKDYLEKNGLEIIHMAYRDHYAFTDGDLVNIYKRFESIDSVNKMIITTEKDAMRLKKFVNIAGELKSVFLYIPVEVLFLNSEVELFNNQILNYVTKIKRNNLLYSKQNQFST